MECGAQQKCVPDRCFHFRDRHAFFCKRNRNSRIMATGIGFDIDAKMLAAGNLDQIIYFHDNASEATS